MGIKKQKPKKEQIENIDKYEYLDEYKKYLEKKTLSYHTIKNYVINTHRLLTDIKAEFKQKIPPAELELYLFNRQKKPHIFLASVIHYFIFLMFARVINESDLKFYKEKAKQVSKQYKNHARKYLATLPLEKCVQLVKTTKNEEIRLIIPLIFDTGGRIGAILKLKLSDIIIENNGDISITKLFLQEKGNKRRLLKITPQTNRLLQDYIKNHPKNKRYIFFEDNKVSQRCLELKYYNIYSIIKNETRGSLENYGVSFHCIRRGTGSYWYSITKDLIAVQNFLGHSSPDTTLKYIQAGAERIQNKMDAEKRDW